MSELLIGGYTRPGVDGGVRRLVPGGIAADVAARTPDPSYLRRSTEHPDLVSAVDEGGDAVVALRASADRSVAVIARVATAGSAPCHLALVRGGSLLLAACYGDGVVSAHPVDADGVPGEASRPSAPAASWCSASTTCASTSWTSSSAGSSPPFRRRPIPCGAIRPPG